MTCDVPRSLLCKNTLQSFGDFELYTKFSNLVQFALLHYNLFKYSFRTYTKIRGCQQEDIIQLYAKTHECSLKNLSKSSSFALWSSLAFSTTTLFYFTLVPMIFLLLINHPTKPLSPGDWTHWSIFSPCNNSLQFLPKIGFLKILHYLVSVFAKLTLPASLSSKETMIWSFWPPQEMPR